jgi:hypothetical protein
MSSATAIAAAAAATTTITTTSTTVMNGTYNNGNTNSNNYVGIDFKLFENIEYPYCPDVNTKYEKVAKIGQGTFG